jgi:hypothetical protein
VVLLVGAGAWWWRQPREFTYIAEYPAETEPIAVDAGYLIPDAPSKIPFAPSHFTFYNWHGVQQWVVHTSEPQPGMWARGDHLNKYMLSPDGRTLVVSIPRPTGLQVACWQEGRLQWSGSVPSNNLERIDLHTISPSRVLVRVDRNPLGSSATTAHWYLLEQGRVIASAPWSYGTRCAPDASCVIQLVGNRYQYCTWSVSKDRLVLHPGYGLPSIPETVFPHGYVAFMFSEQLCGPTGWVHGPWKGQPITLARRYHTMPVANYLTTINDDQAWVIDVRDGSAWQLQTHGTKHEVLGNGRYALVRYQARFPVKLEPFLRQLPRRFHPRRTMYDLVERPGRLRAHLVTVNGSARIDGHDIRLGSTPTHIDLSPPQYRRVLLSRHGRCYVLGW